MCGFVGVIEKGSHFPHINDMLGEIAHRGKDEKDFYLKGKLCMGHNRLSIIDPENGHQPFEYGDWVIVFNGCVYNFKDFSDSNSDTEAIAQAIHEHGIGIVEKFNGMFAIVAHNVKTDETYLIRDRYGIKPLYYWSNDDVFLFGSEVKSFMQHPAFKVEVDTEALQEYFTFQNTISSLTLFKGVRELKNGSYMQISNRRVTKYWEWNFKEGGHGKYSARKTTKYLLKQAVERQLISDAPLGAYLSGGIDSGSIVAFAGKVPTFTCGFDMKGVEGREAHFDESESARKMASDFGCDNYNKQVSKHHIENLEKIVWHLEDLKLGMSYPLYEASNMASKHVKVCLSGAGGDELFGGYVWRYKPEIYDYFQYWNRLGDVEFTFPKTDHPRRVFYEHFADNQGHITFNREKAYNFEANTFLQGVLTCGDKLAMANTLEERFPFLDNDLVDYAQTMPEDLKVDKMVLRDAMKGILPEEVLNAKKQGFSAPDENWYRNNKYISNLLTDRRSEEFIPQSCVDRILKEHNEGKNHRLLIWSLMSFETWCNLFLDK